MVTPVGGSRAMAHSDIYDDSTASKYGVTQPSQFTVSLDFFMGNIPHSLAGRLGFEHAR